MKKLYEGFFSTPALPTITVIITAVAVVFLNMPTPEETREEKISSARIAAIQSDVITTTKSSTATSPDSTGSSGNPTTDGTDSTESSDGSSPVFSITASPSTSTSQDDSATTTASTSSSATTTTTGTPHEYNYDYISAGESPNSSFYQDRLTIIGDSIAYGFNAYGYIPWEHNLAQESLGLWNMDSYYFDTAYGTYGLVDAADCINSPLYFISIGMNDIYGCSPESYGQQMLELAQQVLNRVPTATIVVGSITPVSEYNYYTTNDTIREFNYSLQSAITGADSSQILFFDTYSVLADPNTLALSYDHSGGDGLHIAGYSYEYILRCLFNFLDSTNAIEQIKTHDTTAY